MTRKPKRPGTRSGRRAESLGVTDPFERPADPSSGSSRVTLPRPRSKVRLPSDIADAAEAALDDMLQTGVTAGDGAADDDGEDEPKTETRASSHDGVVPPAPLEPDEDDDGVESLTNTTRASRSSKMPLPAPPRTTSVHTLSNSPPPPRGSPPPGGRLSPAPTPSGATTRLSPPPGSAVPGSRLSPPPSSAPAPRLSPPPGPVPASRLSPPPVQTPPLARTAAPPVQTPPLVRTASPSVQTPTPLGRTTPSPPVHTPTPTPVIPRPRTEVTLGETPMSRLEATTNDRARAFALEESLRSLEEPTRGSLDETARVPSHVEVELESGPVDVDPDELLPLRSDVPPLRVVVLEESSQLGSVQSAIAAAGHIVHLAAAGRDGVHRVLAALHDEGDEIDVVLAALPGGEAVIDAALAVAPLRPIVIASLGKSPVDSINRASSAGADLAAIRPHDVDRMAPLLFAASRLLVERRVALAARGAEHVLRAPLDELADPEPRSLLAFDVFQRVFELEIGRAQRFAYPLSVALFAVEAGSAPPPGIRGILRARAGNALMHAIRDIDVATQLEHERFVVLLPYTELSAAAGVARKVIAAVAAGDPVVAGGRTFPPRLVGAVAGARPGEPLGFTKLMKDATSALEQARRDGAELVVQP